MDSDLAESVSALTAIFEERGYNAVFGKAKKEEVQALRKDFKLPDRYVAFLTEANPLDVETVTPSERVRFIPSSQLRAEQVGYSLSDGDTPVWEGWRKRWVVIAHSALLGDPYFLDTSRPDVEGDCPVMTAMSGTDSLKPILAASSFACFLRILSAAMELAKGFGDDVYDDQDEQLFREAMGSKLRVIDAAAMRAGHWT